jgi:hypothetical protein
MTSTLCFLAQFVPVTPEGSNTSGLALLIAAYAVIAAALLCYGALLLLRAQKLSRKAKVLAKRCDPNEQRLF